MEIPDTLRQIAGVYFHPDLDAEYPDLNALLDKRVLGAYLAPFIGALTRSDAETLISFLDSVLIRKDPHIAGSIWYAAGAGTGYDDEDIVSIFKLLRQFLNESYPGLR